VGGGRGLPPDARSPGGEIVEELPPRLKGGRLAGGCRRGRPGAGRAARGHGMGQHLAQNASLDGPVGAQRAGLTPAVAAHGFGAARKRSATASKSASLNSGLKISRPVPTQLKPGPGP